MEFLSGAAIERSVQQFESDDATVLVLVVPTSDAYMCNVYARYEWQRVDGSMREWLYESRPEAATFGHTLKEAVKRARSLTRKPDGI
jgi:hypothetical protein